MVKILQLSTLFTLAFSIVNAADKNGPKEEHVNCDELAAHIQKKFLQFPVKCFLTDNSTLKVKFPYNYVLRNAGGDVERTCENGSGALHKLSAFSIEIQKYQMALNRCVSRSAMPVPTPKVMGLLTDLQQQKTLMEQCITVYNRDQEQYWRARRAADAQYEREKMKKESLDKFIDESDK